MPWGTNSVGGILSCCPCDLVEETGRRGSLGREAMADTGPLQWRELSDETGLAKALFELDTLNEEEWGGICSGHALLLQETVPPRLIVSK